MNDTTSNKSGECVYCGSADIEYQTEFYDGDCLIFPYTCGDCGKKGKEVYELNFLENQGLKKMEEKQEEPYIDHRYLDDNVDS